MRFAPIRPRHLLTPLLALALAGCGDDATDSGDGPVAGCEYLTGDEPAWALRCGGDTSETIVGLAVDGAGDMLVAWSLGVFEPDPVAPLELAGVELLPDGRDIVFAKIGTDGEPRWVRHFGGPGSQDIRFFARCGDGFVITGANREGESIDLGGGPIDAPHWIGVFDGEGELLWTQTVELLGDFSPNLKVLGADCDDAGGLILTGEVRDGADFGGGPLVPVDLYDGFAARYSPDGDHLWSRLFGAAGTANSGKAIAWTPSGEIVVVGEFGESVDLGGGPLVPSMNGSGVVVAKLDGDGGHQWSLALDTHNYAEGSHVAVDGAGNIAVCGRYEGLIELGGQTHENPITDFTAFDAYLVEFDPDGNATWSASFGSPDGEQSCVLNYDDAGVLVAAGMIGGQPSVRSYAEGALVGERGISGSSSATGYRFGLGSGQAIFAASVQPEADVGLGPMLAYGGDDLIFVDVGYD